MRTQGHHSTEELSPQGNLTWIVRVYVASNSIKLIDYLITLWIEYIYIIGNAHARLKNHTNKSVGRIS